MTDGQLQRIENMFLRLGYDIIEKLEEIRCGLIDIETLEQEKLVVLKEGMKKIFKEK